MEWGEQRKTTKGTLNVYSNKALCDITFRAYERGRENSTSLKGA